MWIVRLALRRPYTFVVVALLIAVLGIVSILTMQTDIFPSINIPVITVIWSYGGLSPTEMQDRVTTVVERAMTSTVNNIEHMESQSVRGTSVVKIYFQPGADVNAAEAEVTAQSQSILKQLPPGILPPLIIRYNAADVPVIQLSMGLVTYLVVIDAERTLLTNQLTLSQDINQQMAASVHVIKALGGGWDADASVMPQHS